MQLDLRPAPVPTPSVASFGRRRDDAQVATLLTGFDELGGVASTDEVIGLMRPHWRQPTSMLARWIVGRQLVSFAWRTQLLLPLFQFERLRMRPREGVIHVVRALADVLDDEGIALWFVCPNADLGDVQPLLAVLRDPLTVLEAARGGSAARIGVQHVD